MRLTLDVIGRESALPTLEWQSYYFLCYKNKKVIFKNKTRFLSIWSLQSFTIVFCLCRVQNSPWHLTMAEAFVDRYWNFSQSASAIKC